MALVSKLPSLNDAFVIEARHGSPADRLGFQRDLFRERDRLERLDGLAYCVPDVLAFGNDRELASFEADEVQEITDEPAHPHVDPLNVGRRPEDLPADVVVRCVRADLCDVHRDSRKRVSQIVAHHAQELVPPFDHLVGFDAFEQKTPVRVVALVSQERRQDSSALFLLVRGDGVGPLVFAAQTVVFSVASGFDFGALGGSGAARRLLVGSRALPPEDFAGALTR